MSGSSSNSLQPYDDETASPLRGKPFLVSLSGNNLANSAFGNVGPQQEVAGAKGGKQKLQQGALVGATAATTTSSPLPRAIGSGENVLSNALLNCEGGGPDDEMIGRTFISSGGNTPMHTASHSLFNPEDRAKFKSLSANSGNSSALNSPPNEMHGNGANADSTTAGDQHLNHPPTTSSASFSADNRRAPSSDDSTDANELADQLYLMGPLIAHAYGGNVDGVRNALDQRADVNLSTPLDKRTALHYAAAAGSVEVCKLLVEEYGARSKPDRFGMLPIHEAERHPDVRAYLYDVVDGNGANGGAGAGRSSGASESLGLHGASTPTGVVSRTTSTGPVFNPPALNPSHSIPAMGNIQRLQSKVFQLCTRMSDFSYYVVAQEVEYFFNVLGLHQMYFAHFTAAQIANHISVLMSSKKVSKAAGSEDVSFALENPDHAFYLSSLGQRDTQMNVFHQVCSYVLCRDRESTEARRNRLAAAAAVHAGSLPSREEFGKYGSLDNKLDASASDNGRMKGFSVTYMATDNPAFQDSKNRENILRLFIVERFVFDKRVSEDESDLQMVATPRFLRTKSEYALSRYQLLLDRVVASKNAVLTAHNGEMYPGDGNGHVVQFATAESSRNFYMHEIAQCYSYLKVAPKRFYIESFANGVVSYTYFFPNTTDEQIARLTQVLKYITHLKMTPGRSGLVWNCVLSNALSPETMTYVLALVKFSHAFFPREHLYPQFVELRAQLSFHAESQTKFDDLYRKALLEILTPERIYACAVKHVQVLVALFEDFSEIAHGRKRPFFNEKLFETHCGMLAEDERLIMRTFCQFNEALRVTNFFKKTGIPGAMSFRFDPEFLVSGREDMYPEIPFGVYLIVGRTFFGWHVRFREIARGGIRCVKSPNKEVYSRNAASLFDETYNLAYTQQRKNKDIPEGGSKGTILLDSTSQDSAKDAFLKYVDSLLDIMQGCNEKDGLHSWLPQNENLFFGPDENTADFMKLGALRAKDRRYAFAYALTTGKSQELGGVPHDLYGITTTGVHEYVLCLLKELNIAEESITKFQTGGPDGDLGSNEILISKDKTVAIVDGSGVAYDPAGLDRTELTRLARARKPIVNFNSSYLSDAKEAFVVSVDDSNITLPDGSTWRSGADLRNAFPLTKFARADLFVPCGGRPATISLSNVKQLFTPEGGLQWKYVVEGANLFFTDPARLWLERHGVIMFKDASANKGGVTSSSLEVFAALAMSEQLHEKHMTVKPHEQPPTMYVKYVQEIIQRIKENCRKEFYCIWNHCSATSSGGAGGSSSTSTGGAGGGSSSSATSTTTVSRTRLTAELSTAITQIHDSLMENLDLKHETALVNYVLTKAIPTLLLEKIGLEAIIKRVPDAYLKAMISAYVASSFVYETGLQKANHSYSFHQYMLRLNAAATAACLSSPELNVNSFGGINGSGAEDELATPITGRKPSLSEVRFGAAGRSSGNSAIKSPAPAPVAGNGAVANGHA
mmetsp:Transcript_21979/g.55378  ORF Transcript_21979/g.55378 Transcript_21979/m.55378 type:complete len:1478 (+) Transcript_21979:477-4910(+)|eukprot:CAMPEP_0178991552 /NCGR_PEP_ID=MMETSP0795-20121207/5597_1 /TAXON_ID=88552 /ORGANISM="Amoebophrya sp., Strain Ameob2" /LENGTH=1477 /DNA_ID=CAMNT_0020683285 /DNA_START=466 /DNA_END=4899 /DNA_ORIENTATION=+